ncbi:hypothetical protein N9R79_11165 [Vibrio sp.]|nr:hypothetical protein [Vibrio sp.]
MPITSYNSYSDIDKAVWFNFNDKRIKVKSFLFDYVFSESNCDELCTSYDGEVITNEHPTIINIMNDKVRVDVSTPESRLFNINGDVIFDHYQGQELYLKYESGKLVMDGYASYGNNIIKINNDLSQADISHSGDSVYIQFDEENSIEIKEVNPNYDVFSYIIFNDVTITYFDLLSLASNNQDWSIDMLRLDYKFLHGNQSDDSVDNIYIATLSGDINTHGGHDYIKVLPSSISDVVSGMGDDTIIIQDEAIVNYNLDESKGCNLLRLSEGASLNLVTSDSLMQLSRSASVVDCRHDNVSAKAIISYTDGIVIIEGDISQLNIHSSIDGSVSYDTWSSYIPSTVYSDSSKFYSLLYKGSTLGTVGNGVSGFAENVYSYNGGRLILNNNLVSINSGSDYTLLYEDVSEVNIDVELKDVSYRNSYDWNSVLYFNSDRLYLDSYKDYSVFDLSFNLTDGAYTLYDVIFNGESNHYDFYSTFNTGKVKLLEHLKEGRHYLSDGDDYFSGVASNIDPKSGDDYIENVDEIWFGTGYDHDIASLYTPKGILVHFDEFTSKDDITQNITYNWVQAHKDQHIYDLELSLNDNDSLTLEKVLACFTICTVQNVRIEVGGTIYSLESLITQSDDFFWLDLNNKIESIFHGGEGGISFNPVVSFDAFNFTQEFSITLLINDVQVCHYSLDRNYSPNHSETNPLNCILDMSDYQNQTVEFKVIHESELGVKEYTHAVTIETIEPPSFITTSVETPIPIYSNKFVPFFEHNESLGWVDFYVNGELVHENMASSAFQFDSYLTFPLDDGDNTLLYVLKNAGGEARLEQKVFYKNHNIEALHAEGVFYNHNFNIDWTLTGESVDQFDINIYVNTSTHWNDLGDFKEKEIVASSNTSETGIVFSGGYKYEERAHTLHVALLDGFGYPFYVSNLVTVVKDITSPLEPSFIDVESKEGAIKVEWKDNDTNNDTDQFELQLYQSSTMLETITFDHVVTEYEFSDLNLASYYRVYLYAIDKYGNRSSDAYRNVKTLTTNPTLTVTTQQDDFLIFNWSTSNLGSAVELLDLYYSDEPFTDIDQAKYSVTSISRTTSSQRINGLDVDKTYYVTLIAYMDYGRKLFNSNYTVIETTPVSDPPEISAIHWNNTLLGTLFSMTEAGTLTVEANDSSGVAYLEVFFNGEMIARDERYNDGFNIPLDPYQYNDGEYTLTIKVADIYENVTTRDITVSLLLALPSQPHIDTPSSDLLVGESHYFAHVTADVGTHLQLRRQQENESQTSEWIALTQWVEVGPTGRIRFNDVPLIEGENTWVAVAKNRAGETVSASRSIIRDSAFPSQPQAMTATRLETGEVLLAWEPGINSPQEFIVEWKPVLNTQFERVALEGDSHSYIINPIQSGEWEATVYAQITTEESVTQRSDKSRVTFNVDRIAPTATMSITTDGHQKNQQGNHHIFGHGQLTLQVTVSEPLKQTPYLALIFGQNVYPIQLTSQTLMEYEGVFTTPDLEHSGAISFVYSSVDLANNQGTTLTELLNVSLDLQAPKVVSIESQPSSPVAIDQHGTALDLIFTLDEALSDTVLPKVHWQRRDHQLLLGEITTEYPVYLGENRWSLSLELPDDTAAIHREFLSLSLDVTDTLGNQGLWHNTTEHTPQLQVELYRGELPPLPAPAELSAQVLAQGQVKLSWSSVPSASIYHLYRRLKEDSDFTLVQRIDVASDIERVDDTEINDNIPSTLHWVDTVAQDDNYTYAIATVREANGQQAISALRTIENVNSDSTPPVTVENITATLTPQGIEVNFSHDHEPNSRYELYRAGITPIIDVTDQSPVATLTLREDNSVENEWVLLDSAPSSDYPAYAILVVDEAGNHSDVSETVYLNLDLLPVSHVRLEKRLNALPELTWQYSGESIAGFMITLGETEDYVVELSNSESQYRDTGYQSNHDQYISERLYGITAIDHNQQSSLSYPIRLPEINMTIRNSHLKRRVLNQLHVDVEYRGNVPLTGYQLSINIDGQIVQTESNLTLLPGMNTYHVVVSGALEGLDDIEAILQLTGTPQTGEVIVIEQAQHMKIENGLYVLNVDTRNINKGSTGQIRFEFDNRSDTPISVLTAKNHGQTPSPTLIARLSDDDGNVYSIAPLSFFTGEHVVTVENGDSIMTIPPHRQLHSAWMEVSIPDVALDHLNLTIEISELHYRYGEAQHITLFGAQATEMVTLTPLDYRVDEVAVTPEQSIGQEVITITGQAVGAHEFSRVDNAPLTLVVAHNGFELSELIQTDENGHFTYALIPNTDDVGQFDVSIIHPESNERPAQATFIIQSAYLLNGKINIEILEGGSRDFPLNVNIGQGTALDSLEFVFSPPLPQGVSVTANQQALNDLLGQTQVTESHWALPMTLQADADQSGQHTLTVVASINGQLVTLGQTVMNYQTVPPRANIHFTPNMLEFGVVVNQQDTLVLHVENQGSEDAYDVNFTLSESGSGQPVDWVTADRSLHFDRIPAGERVSISFTASPYSGVVANQYELTLMMQAANHSERRVPILINVVEAGIGKANMKVEDLFTHTLNEVGRLIEGVDSALIELQHEIDPEIQFSALTTSQGEAYFDALPQGFYYFTVSKSGYQSIAGRMQVKPGLVTQENVFIDYQVVNLSWNIVEVAIEDKYDITLNVDFKADVPAAILTVSPNVITLPDLEEGGVFNGFVSVTNRGLVRADNINMQLPPSNEYFDFVFSLAHIPDTLEAGETVRIPYRVTALAPTEPSIEGSGGGCGLARYCATIQSDFACANGDRQGSNTQTCFVQDKGVCHIEKGGSSSGGGQFNYNSGAIWQGGFQGDTTSTNDSPFPLPTCRVDCPEHCDPANEAAW